MSVAPPGAKPDPDSMQIGLLCKPEHVELACLFLSGHSRLQMQLANLYTGHMTDEERANIGREAEAMAIASSVVTAAHLFRKGDIAAVLEETITRLRAVVVDMTAVDAQIQAEAAGKAN